MFKATAGAVALFFTTSLFAQDTADLERRIAEMQRQIEVLAHEVEVLKTGAQKKAPEADQGQYGLGAAASKVYRSDTGVSIGGYGEFAYQNSQASEPASADVVRAVVYTGYKFSDRVLFNSELEVEHANLERGGNVETEFAYLDYLLRPSANVRAGLVLVPVGLTNEQHEPTAFFGARRPAVEDVIIPSTWSDLGAGVFGDVGRISYRGYVLTGLDAAGFSAGEPIREGRQAGGNALAESGAIVGRADWHPFEGTMFGGSVYTGNSGQGRGFRGRVTLAEVHADSRFRGVSLRALFTRGTIGDAAVINEAKGLQGEESIGKSFGGWYVEGGYYITPMFAPYARYERLDTQRSVPSGFVRNPANDQNIFTVGFAFKPISQTIIKADWSKVKNRAHTGADQFNVALGYIF